MLDLSRIRSVYLVDPTDSKKPLAFVSGEEAWNQTRSQKQHVKQCKTGLQWDQ